MSNDIIETEERQIATESPQPLSGRSINALLLSVVVAAMLPLCAYLAYLLYAQARDLRMHVKERAQSVAARAAGWTRREMRTTEHLLRELSARPQVRALDPAHCDPLLPELLPLLPQYANISVVAADGTFVCSATPARPGQRVPPHDALKAALQGGFAVSEPMIGVLPRVFVVSTAYPVRAADGRIRAALTMPIELSELRLMNETAALPPRARVRLIDARGTVLASSAEETLGSNLFDTEIDAGAAERRTATNHVGPDGVARTYAFAAVGVNGWRTVADMPADEALANARARIAWSLALAAAALAGAVASAFAIARHIARPLRAVSGAMRRSRPGDYVRVRPDGPREVQRVALRFNDMIDECIRVEAAIVESETRLSLAVEAGGIGIWDWGVARGTIYVSPQWRRQLGFEDEWSPDWIAAWRNQLHPADRAHVLAELERLLHGGETVYDLEYRVITADGRLAWLHSRADVTRASNGAATRLVGANVDVTARRRMEDDLQALVARLRELSLALLEAEDRERRRISRDLHDRVSANLSAMQLTLSGIAGRIEPSAHEALRPLLSDLRELVLSTSAEIRNVISDLRPPALDDFGLAPALRSYAMTAASRMQAELDFDADPDLPRLRPAVETALFRIAQEALTNVAKHARAQQVRIELTHSAGAMVLEIEDDGTGFDAGATGHGGNGLRNMRERADAVGASFTIASAPGEGTRITIGAPAEAAV